MAAVKPYVPHLPSEVQRDVLTLEAEEAFFGGAPRGGKSDVALMDCLRYVDVPGYGAGIFRLAKEDWSSPTSVLQRAHQWFDGTPAVWDAGTSSYRFPSGAFIHFGSGQNGNADAFKRSLQGQEFQKIWIDELPQWPELLYRWLIGTRLTPLKAHPIPLTARGTGNPEGPGKAWVKARFVSEARHVVTRETVKDDLAAYRRGVALPKPRLYSSPPSTDAVEIAKALGREPQGAYFIPAFYTDNPGIDHAAYRVQLAKLAPADREALEWSNWDVEQAGNFFKREKFELIDSPPSLVGARIVRAWDLAATEQRPGSDPDWTVGEKRARLANGRFVVLHVCRFRANPGETEQRIRAQALEDGPSVEQHVEQEGGSSGKFVRQHFAASVFAGLPVTFHRATGDKVTRAKPAASAVENGLVSVVRGPWLTDYLDELVPFPTPGVHDDQVDADSLAHAVLCSQGASSNPPPEPDAPEISAHFDDAM